MESFEEKAIKFVEQARLIHSKSPNWITFSNKLFDQDNGLFTKVFNEQEKDRFIDSDYYCTVSEMIIDLMKQNNPLPKIEIDTSNWQRMEVK